MTLFNIGAYWVFELVVDNRQFQQYDSQEKKKEQIVQLDAHILCYDMHNKSV